MSLFPILSEQSAYAVTPGVIETPGPLERIATSPDLNCDVRYVGDEAPEFYSATACGTFVAVGGTLYGPENVPAGGSASPRTTFTPISQEGPVGSGTAAEPWVVTTTVDLGSSGLRLTQTDAYVSGQQSYLTRVRLVNTADEPVSATVYRAGDCYVADSDYGYGEASEGTVACVAESGRVAKWIPVTAGSAYLAGFYDDVWSAIGSQRMFPDTVHEGITDNAAGLSWQIEVEAGDDGEAVHLTAFSEDATTTGDRDGDGLLDEWETHGLDVDGDGVPEIDLPAMGATPDHKDLFVEVDWMTDPRSCVLWWCWGGRDFAPQQRAIEDVVRSFADAPVSNPDGTTGIRLHVDAGPDYVMNPQNGATWGARSRANSLPHQERLGVSRDDVYDWSEFNALKADNFETARADVFHYAIFADRYGDSSSSGIAQIADANWEGDSFLVTDGAFGNGAGFSRREESGTFMHEFGHILGLRHGGGDHINEKPNYQSIMSYFWQMRGRPLDFSRQVLPTLDEAALMEEAGLPGATGAYAWYCPGGTRETSRVAETTDWDCDGEIEENAVSVDTNVDRHLHVLEGFDDWSNLVYDGGAVGAFGVHDLNDQNPPLQFSPLQEASYEELLERDLLGAPGDGSVSVVGPYVLLPGVTDQTLRVQVANAGSTTAAYRLSLDGVPGITASADVVDVPGHETGTVDVPVDGAGLVPGTYDLRVTLSDPDGEELASTITSVLVPDLEDARTRAELVQIRDALSSPQPGLDETVRARAVGALTETLLRRATITAVSGDTQSTGVGMPFDVPLAVRVVSEDGAPLTGVPVAFTVTDGAAHFAGATEVTAVSDGDGRAAASGLTAGGTPGPVTVVAGSGGASATFALLVAPDETREAGVDVELQAPERSARGEQVTLTVTVRNTGGLPTDEVRTSVWIPRSATVVAPSGTTSEGARYTLPVASLAPGATATYEFALTKTSNGNLPVRAGVIAQVGADHLEAWEELHIAR